MLAANLELGYHSRHSVDPFNMSNWNPAVEHELSATSAAMQIGTFIQFGAARRDFSAT